MARQRDLLFYDARWKKDGASVTLVKPMTILLFLAVLTVLVVIHEAGHFFVAKWSGVKPEEFGVGFPPRAAGWQRIRGRWQRVQKDEASAEHTIWSLNWLPLGGFVRLKGERGEAAKDADSFVRASFWRKVAIILAGVVMNILFAWVVFTIGFLVGIPTASEGLSPYAKQRDPRVEVSVVVPGSPAEAAGIALGDRVTTIGQTVISSADEALAALRAESARQEVFSVSVLRDGQTQTVSVMPAFIESIQRQGIGIGLEGVVTARLPVWLAPIEGARTTLRTTGAIYAGLGSLVTRLFQGESVGGEVSGPIGIAVMTGKVAENGVWALARFAALLSLNLAVVNSLPIPALDGGRLLFIIIERLRGPRHRPETEALIHTIGFFLLIGLILAITLHDVRQYGGGIWRRFTGLITEQGV